MRPQAPFVAITGTNGKSTTTALIAHLLREAGHDVQLGGNIGTAILSLEPPRAGRVHVIEMSSYQIDLAPDARSLGRHSAQCQRGPHRPSRHAAQLRGRQGAAGRARPARRQRHHRGRRRLVPGERRSHRAVRQAGAARLGAANRSPTVSMSRAIRSCRLPPRPRAPIASLRGIGSLRGVHNAQNAACASGAALAIGLQPAAIQSGLRSFPGLAHRMETFGRKGRVLFVNDSKATNADSAAQALACFSDIFWIAGGKPKTGGIDSLAGFFPRIRKAYLIGEAAPAFAADARRAGSVRGCRQPRPGGRARRPGCRGGDRDGAGRAALAGLRLVRSVPQFRGARG